MSAEPRRHVYLLQRKTTRLGAGLGKTTGWVHRQTLTAAEVEMIGGVTYERIDDAGLHVTIRPDEKSEPVARVLAIDTILVCAGQESVRDLADDSRMVVGGADVAAELDAKRAIRQATEAAAQV